MRRLVMFAVTVVTVLAATVVPAVASIGNMGG